MALSLNTARTLIDRMQTDDMFREQVMALETLEERSTHWQAAGFDCTPDEVNQLAGTSEREERPENLPLSWACKGPCHTKCAARDQ